MSTVAEVSEALPRLTTRELQQIESLLIRLCRERKAGIIFDDSYGVLKEEDVAAVRQETLDILDGKAANP